MRLSTENGLQSFTDGKHSQTGRTAPAHQMVGMTTKKEGGGVGASRTTRRTLSRALASGVTVSLIGAVSLLAGGPASAQTAIASANYNGYASGAVVHAGVLTSGPTTLAELDQAFAGAAANSAGFTSQIDSKINTVIQAADASKKSGARGAGIELGIGQTNPVATASALIAQKAVATAPPNSGLIDNKVNLALDPVVNATLAEGRAQANWYTDPQGNNGCALGQDISNGFGHLANATAVGSPSPSASLVNAPGELSTTSFTRLVPQTDATG